MYETAGKNTFKGWVVIPFFWFIKLESCTKEAGWTGIDPYNQFSIHKNLLQYSQLTNEHLAFCFKKKIDFTLDIQCS